MKNYTWVILILAALAGGYFFACYQTWNADKELQRKVQEQSEQVEILQQRLEKFRRDVDVLDRAVKETTFDESP
tara:strand:+ start:2569 stop:2790 length:222 start_codon:yes stop_codon:yes gene_type:complete